MASSNALNELLNWEENSKNGLYPLPPSIYTSPELLDLEIDNIFNKQWLCVGHTSELSKPGDYITFDAVGEPILVVCDENNTIRAYANVCQHRSAIVASGCGNRKSFICPYHSWTYGLNGRLRGAPLMDMDQQAIEQVSLPEYRVEIWQSLVFVSLNPEVEPLAQQLEGLTPRISPFNHENYKVIIREDAEVECNWKVLVENFCDGYHVMTVHKNTLEPGHPSTTFKYWDEGRPGGDAYNHHTVLHTNDITGNDRTGEEDYKRLDGQWEKFVHIFCVYPSFVVTLDTNFSISLSIRPNGPQSLKYTLRMGIIPNEDNTDENGEFTAEAVKEAEGLVEVFMGEDKAVIKGVQQGLAAAKGSTNVLHPWEETNVEFGRYLSRMLRQAS